jgi:regulator of telomere elongation helicase 1
LFCYVCSPFPIRLENSHVIQPSQVWVGVLSNGPSDSPLNSSFKTRETEDYKQALGNALSTRSFPLLSSSPLDPYGQLKDNLRSLRVPVNFMRIVPSGLLVFFPSYTALTTCVDAWKRPVRTATCH